MSNDGEVEPVEQTVVLPAIYQYSINRYPAGQRVMLTSDAYDYINRVMGVQFYLPPTVNDERGNVVPNPIHRPDYIYLRMVGIWRNDAGQMVSYQEDVEVDYKTDVPRHPHQRQEYEDRHRQGRHACPQ